ncbi:MAG: hypothetical protein RIQ53_2904 [Pseudomonadota bacterium]|jgi:LPS-assembly protein
MAPRGGRHACPPSASEPVSSSAAQTAPERPPSDTRSTVAEARGRRLHPARATPVRQAVATLATLLGLATVAAPAGAATATTTATDPATPASGGASADAAPAPTVAGPGLRLCSDPALAPAGAGDDRQRPLFLSAGQLTLRPDIAAQAAGGVDLRQGATRIRAEQLDYDAVRDTVQVQGPVELESPAARVRGQSLQMQVSRLQGHVLAPEFELTALGAGGSARRLDLQGREQLQVEGARYSSCPRGSGLQPDWLLRADSVSFDLAAQEGVARGAVLEFLGVPILGAPVLSFPLGDERKSGWLPPTLVPVNSRNGLTIGAPYYWNIAPDHDATLTPVFYSRLGLGLQGEARWLRPRDEGQFDGAWLPHDRVAGTDRHHQRLRLDGTRDGGWRYTLDWLRASDDDYWKDFSGALDSRTPRLLNQSGRVEWQLPAAWGEGQAWAAVQRWQVLQTALAADRIDVPYERAPQLGMALAPALPMGLRLQAGGELDRFQRADGLAPDSSHPQGWRARASLALERRFGHSGAWLTPRLQTQLTRYELDADGSPALRHAQRIIPTASIEGGLAFDHQGRYFGLDQQVSLEPRLLYVHTPRVDQSGLPLFDTAERDFNLVSLFATNPYLGGDRVADAQMLTLGTTLRWVDVASGAETLRLGAAQRLRFADQRTTLSGEPLTQRFSDVLLEGATSLFKPWHQELTLQYSPDQNSIVRSVAQVRYQPGPYRTLSMGYSMTRAASEQLQAGWQWPVWRGSARPLGAADGCGGTVYAVGRINYSLREARATDALLGVEYDAGCWIGRVALRRQSTGSDQATTALMWQLEFTGLSRIGSSPLQTLKDNVPGYQLLREADESYR